MSVPIPGLAGERIRALRPNEALPSARPFPEAFSALTRVGRGASWSPSLDALETAGFLILAQTRRLDTPWPDDLDPMGPEPRPAKRNGKQTRRNDEDAHARRFALLLHPEGFLVSMDSYFTQGRHILNQLRVHYQVDIGADIHSLLRREGFSSGSASYLHDGSSIVIGDSEVITGSAGPLSSVLRACYHQARPLPLEFWERSFFYVAPELFTPAPPDAARSYGQGPLTQRFAPRVAADWKAFIDSLPPAAARFIDYRQDAIAPDHQPLAVSPPPSVHHYIARQLKAIGHPWPSADESQTLASWSESLSIACATHLPLEIASPHERVVGGLNVLHLLASFAPYSDSALPVSQGLFSAWVDAQDPADTARWLSERDATGLTPVGVALLANVSRSSSSNQDAPTLTPSLAYFMRRGWLGPEGELGQVIHDALAPHDSAFFDQRQRFNLGHAALLDQIEIRSREIGHSWAAPIQTPSGMLATAADAIEALLSKLGPTDGPAKAYVEALALRVSIDSPKPSVSAAASSRL